MIKKINNTDEEKFAYKPFSYFMMNNLKDSLTIKNQTNSSEKITITRKEKIEESLKNIDIYSHNLKKSIEHSINKISRDIIDKSKKSEAKKISRIVLGLNFLIFIVRITLKVTEGNYRSVILNLMNIPIIIKWRNTLQILLPH